MKKIYDNYLNKYHKPQNMILYAYIRLQYSSTFKNIKN